MPALTRRQILACAAATAAAAAMPASAFADDLVVVTSLPDVARRFDPARPSAIVKWPYINPLVEPKRLPGSDLSTVSAERIEQVLCADMEIT